ncbi:MAG: class I SAM-dependent methyltransferase [Aulosira sp. DedQUE10]|nr:class I SAM-dependent methyltransferase [Aulosira sp. DedQUE10]
MTTKYSSSWEEAVIWLRCQPDQQEFLRYCYYDDPLDAAANRFNISEEWQTLNKLLSKYIPGKVLELGAGRGISSYAFAKAGCEVTALEPDSSSLVGAKAIQSLFDSNNLSIEIIQEYGETLPFKDNTFDIVYGRAVLHHAKDLTKFCQEAARVLKPGGVLIFTREHVISKKEDLQQFLDSHPLHFLYGGENAYLLKEYLRAITKAGLKLQKIIAPFESVINYAPMTQKEFQSTVTSTLNRRFGSVLGHKLSTLQATQKFFSWYLSQTSNTPGRNYSFLAVKK